MAGNEYAYMIWNDDTHMTLIRFQDAKCYTFDPDEPGEWRRSPVKDSIIEGSGDWVWYDDVPDEDVESWMNKIRDIYKKAKK